MRQKRPRARVGCASWWGGHSCLLRAEVLLHTILADSAAEHGVGRRIGMSAPPAAFSGQPPLIPRQLSLRSLRTVLGLRRARRFFMSNPLAGASTGPALSAAAETIEGTQPEFRPRPEHKDPESIGPYRILERIGEGGMGLVYKAEQRTPVRRVVALKVIKLGMDTSEVVARFEAERQALALMGHPNAAKVFEAGITEQGRPYFAMEFVAGVPLTDYCDQNKLTA